jgi:hypothetical protein
MQDPIPRLLISSIAGAANRSACKYITEKYKSNTTGASMQIYNNHTRLGIEMGPSLNGNILP